MRILQQTRFGSAGDPVENNHPFASRRCKGMLRMETIKRADGGALLRRIRQDGSGDFFGLLLRAGIWKTRRDRVGMARCPMERQRRRKSLGYSAVNALPADPELCRSLPH